MDLSTGQLVVPYRFDWIGVLQSDQAIVSEIDKLGMIDESGKVIIEPTFTWLQRFSEGLAEASLSDWDEKLGHQPRGYIDLSGKMVIEPRFEWAHSFSEGRAVVQENGLWGVIDKTGKYVVRPTYTGLYHFYEGLAAVTVGEEPEELYDEYGNECDDRKWGFIDETGKLVVPMKYDKVASFSHGLAAVRKDDRWGMIDRTGKLVIPLKYKELRSFRHKRAAVRDTESGLWGYLDTSGKFAIEPQFKTAEDFHEGLALVAVRISKDSPSEDERGQSTNAISDEPFAFLDRPDKAHKYGYIDPSGKLAIEPQFDRARHFYNGYATVYIGERRGRVDKDGKLFMFEFAHE